MSEIQDQDENDVVAYIYGDTEPAKESIRAALKAKNGSSMSRLEKDPYYTVTFSEPPKKSGGFVIGSHSRADLVIAGAPNLSGRHFALTFDSSNELVVENLSSTAGTRLVYGRKDTKNSEVGDLVMEVESSAGVKVWSARGPKVTNGAPVQIQATSEAKFRLIVPNYDKKSRVYMGRVQKFLEGQPVIFTDSSRYSRPRTRPSPWPKTPVVEKKSSRANKAFWKKKLSSGRCSVVYHCWNVTTREAFAINEPVHENPLQLEKWKTEAGVLKGLHHDHIVPPLSLELESRPRLLFAYPEYGTLFDYIAHSPQHHNAQVAVQLLEALEFLHEKGLIHRDVKPANVLVYKRDKLTIEVKLADFALARAEGDALMSAPHYVAPEIIDGKNYDSRVDIWSLGTLLVHLECHGVLPSESHSQSPSSPTINSETRSHLTITSETHSSPTITSENHNSPVITLETCSPPTITLETQIPLTIASETHSSPSRTTDCSESPGQRFIKFVEEENSQLASPFLSFVLENMLRIDPKQRLATSACLVLANNRLGGVFSTPASLDPAKLAETAADVGATLLEHSGKVKLIRPPTSKSRTSLPFCSKVQTGRKVRPSQVRRSVPSSFALQHQRVPHDIADEIEDKMNEMREMGLKDCESEVCLPSESNWLELELSQQLDAANQEALASETVVDGGIEPELSSTRLKRRRQESADSEARPGLMAEGQEPPATKQVRKESFEAELDPDRMAKEQEFSAT